jgi:hypothetical protein
MFYDSYDFINCIYTVENYGYIVWHWYLFYEDVFGKHDCVGVNEFKKNVITLAVNDIVLWILDSEKVKEQTFLDVIALYLNVILICIFVF